MSGIPEEYLSGFDFGFNAVDDIPQSTSQSEPSPIAQDVEGIVDNVLRIENKVDALTSSISTLTAKLSSLDDEFDVVKTTTENEVKGKLTQVEKLIMPLLVNLLKSSDKDYIHWPDREQTIKSQIDKLLSITRGE
jgi:archaellum component FlaC